MFNNIINIIKSATSFLQTGIVPPNTPENLRVAMERENHLSSKKFFIIFTSILMLALVYYSSVSILWFIPKLPEIISAYVTIFTKTMEIFAIIIATYLGTQAAVDLKYNSSSNAGTQGDIEVVKEEITENLTNNTKEDDYQIK